MTALLVPRHSWLGCVVSVRVLGLGLRLTPATPGWGVGMCVCSCARSACTPPLLAGVCGVCVCAWARGLAATRHSWLGCLGVCVFGCTLSPYPATPGWGVCCGSVCLGFGFGCPRHTWLGSWGVCVFVCPLRLYPATPSWGVWCVCVCLGWGFGCAPPHLAGVLGCVCVPVPAPLVPRHSSFGCAVWVCVPGLGVWLRPATPGWGVWVCVCLGARSALTPPLLAGVCAVGLFAWASVSAAPATPGWGVGVCVCSCARSTCTTPLLAGMCGVGVCAWALVLAAPRHSWLRCWDVCVFVCPLCLYPATLGRAVWRGCVCWGLGFRCAPPLLAGSLGCVCVCVPAPLVPRHSWLGFVVCVCVLELGFRLRPATPGWGVAVCVCLCARSGCSPPLLAGLCGVCVCAWAWVSAAPRHSWLGCWGVCVFVCSLRLFPATLGWGLRCRCVCLGSSFGCPPPLLARGLGCVCVRVPAPPVPRHSWFGCAAEVCVPALGVQLRPATPGWVVLGCVCLCARPPVPRHSWLGCVLWVCVLGPWHTNATDPPRGAQPPQGVQAEGTEKNPHTRTPAPTTRRSRTPTARPVGGQSGEGERLTPDAPRENRRHPPRGRPTATPTTRKLSRGELGPDRPPPSTPDRARDRGRTRGGARTTWNGPTSAQCRDHARCARHTTQRGGERTPRERERTHTKGARGDYQKGNQTESAERTECMEWRTSERG